jgi:hypothetical protein
MKTNKKTIKGTCFVLLIMAVFSCGDGLNEASAAGSSGASGSGDSWQYSLREIDTLKDKYPDADAVILRHSVDIEMDEQGLISRRIMRRVALFSDNAFRRYADPRILYNSATQELDVSVARVYMRDGTGWDSGSNAFNQSTPFAFSQAPDYTDWQEMVVTHVGIEKDCVAELVYTIRDKEMRRPWLSGVEHLAHDDPALVTELTITIPAGSRLNYACANGVPEPVSSANDSYYWVLEGVPCSPPVDGGVWRGEHLPTITYSTARDWDEVSSYIAGEFAKCSTLESDGEVPDDENTLDSILKMHKECVDCVRSVNASFALFDGSARNAEQIYQSAYAHALDRAILLSAKLKKSHIASNPVLIPQGRNWSRDVPAPELFDRIFLEVFPADSKNALLLDPQHEYRHDTKSVLAGRTLMRCGMSAEFIELQPKMPDENASSLELILSIDDEGKMNGEGSVIMKGTFSPYYSVRGVKDETEQFMKSMVESMLPTATMAGWNVRTLEVDHVELGFRFEAELPEANENNRIYLDMPNPFSEEMSRINRVHAERSEYPVPVRVVPCHMQVSVTFKNLKNYSLEGDIINFKENNSVGSMTAEMETNTHEEDSKITLTKNLIIQKEIIPSTEYKKLRSLLLKYGEGQIILQSKDNE